MKFFRKFLLISVVISLISPPLQSIAAPDKVVLTVHYKRLGGDYAGWNLWLWKNSDDNTKDVAVSNSGVALDGDDAFGKKVTLTIDGMSAFKDIGIIVRLNDWAQKDVSEDRFITKFDSAGKAEIWLVQGDKTIYYEEPALKARMIAATFTDFRQLEVQISEDTSLKSGPNDFTLSNGPKVLSVRALNGNENATTFLELTLDSDAQIDTNYTLSHPKFGAILVDNNKIYDSKTFIEKYTYTGDDLGATYTKAKTSFRLWAPTARSVSLITYANSGATTGTSLAMRSDEKGTWVAELAGDKDGLVYTYKVEVGGNLSEVVDPYARAVTVNGKRGVVVDLTSTNPTRWISEKPTFSGKPTDAIFYELHIRDLSMDSSAPFPKDARGKYTAFNFTNLKGRSGQPVGVAAIKDLGVTHVQLLPIYDFASVDESDPSFNWGYDPQNYNAPEGSYSTDPTDPKKRIVELKGAIQSLQDQGLRVVMDVVYNHVYEARSFSQNQIIPGYWFRTDSSGNLTNGSGCGNDVASERPMVRKFIVDSVKYWASEYHLSGFRFDLMGLLDRTTMKQVRAELSAIDPSIIVIGEGWNMGSLPNSQKASQSNIEELPGISVFNDQIRDGVKGSVFSSTEPGWATGSFSRANNVKAGIVGNTNFGKGILNTFTTADPGQSVNYVEAHDNNTLQDKLLLSTGKASSVTVSKLHRFAGSIPLLAQGLPFIHAGQEFQRSKGGDSNSYQSGDVVNSLKWNLVATNATTRNYYKGLIALRKAHPAFRISDAATVKSAINFLKTNDQVIAYSIDGKSVGDSWGSIVVIHNASSKAQRVTLPSSGAWKVVVEGDKAGVKTLGSVSGGTTINALAQSTTVLYKN